MATTPAVYRDVRPSPAGAIEIACNFFSSNRDADKMFAYNENKQAYIADVTAGTYAQPVEAAESCQVSIIHPSGQTARPERAEPARADAACRSISVAR
jgi:hypothetical protein